MTSAMVKSLRESADATFYDPLKAEFNQAADYVEKLEGMVLELLQSNWDQSWPTMRKYDTFEEYRDAVMGQLCSD
jgi:hypothetical protein